jgi:hypothetical protein
MWRKNLAVLAAAFYPLHQKPPPSRGAIFGQLNFVLGSILQRYSVASVIETSDYDHVRSRGRQLSQLRQLVMSIDWLNGPHEKTTAQPFITGLIASAKYVMRDSHLDTGG